MFKLTSDKIENDSINFQSHPLLLECANFDNLSIFIENGASNKPYDDFPWLGLTIYHVANKSMVTKIRRLKFRGLFYFKSNLWPFKKWSHPGPPFVFFKHKFYRKNCRLQLDSNLDRRKRRRARWPPPRPKFGHF